MPVHTVSEAEGWAGIAALLMRARPGDRIEIGAGRYEGSGTLSVPSGVTLAGLPGHALSHRGEAIAILVEKARDVTLTDLMLTGIEATQDGDERAAGNQDSYGLICIIDSHKIMISSSTVCGAKRGRSCIDAFSSYAVTVTTCTTTDAQRGISFWGSEGCISKNEAVGNDYGIFLARDPRNRAKPSQARIQNNQCHDNERAGIILMSSDGEVIEENDCWRNGNGLELSRETRGRADPSRARIRANRCYDNEESGIILFSSKSDTIEDNDCWRNKKNGIILQRHPSSPAIPSQASISGNRCHDNEGTGIVVLDSESYIIENNDCWLNGEGGICLQSNYKAGSNSSPATVRANRCHDDKTSGIILMSTECKSVENNDCWGNGDCGIALQPASGSRTLPSSARISVNRCHGNRGPGITLYSSGSRAIERNNCWDNKVGIALLIQKWGAEPLPRSLLVASNAVVRHNLCQANSVASILFQGGGGQAECNRSRDNKIDGISILPDPRAPFAIAPPLLSDNVVDPYLDLPSLFQPTLSAALRKVTAPRSGSPWLESGLTGYLTTGCSGCFRAFWIGHRRAASADEESQTTPDPRHWRISEANGATTLTRGAVSRGDPLADLLGLVERRRRGTNAKAAGSTHWIALVSPDETDVDTIVQTLAAQAEPQAQPGFREGGLLGEPIDLDMESGPAPLRDRLSDALMTNRNRHRARLDAILRTPLVIIALALLTLVPLAAVSSGHASALTDAAIALGRWLDIAKWSLSGWGFATAAFVASGLSFLWSVDLFLPRHLKLMSRPKSPIDGALKRVERAGLGNLLGLQVVKLRELLPESVRDTLDARADLRWQRRLMFGRRASVSVLILRDVSAWRAGDVAWLKQLTAAIPTGNALIVAIHVDGRLSLRPILLAPEDPPWSEGWDLYLNDDEDRLRLMPPDRPASVVAEQWRSLFGLMDNNAVAELATEISDPAWTPTDLIPSLPIASAPTSRARLTALRSRDMLQQTDLLAELRGAKALFVGESNLGGLGDNAIEPLFAISPAARALRLAQITTGPRTSRVLTGRVAARRSAGLVLGQAWPEGADWEEYAASALRFGIWQRCNGLVAQLASGLPDRYAILSAQRELDALIFLGSELRRIRASNCPLHGEAMYDDAFSALREAIESLPPGEGYSDLVLRFLGAEAQCVEHKSDLGVQLMARVKTGLATQDTANSFEKPTNATDCFCRDVFAALVDLQAMDRESAEQKLAGLLGWRWRALPEGLRVQVQRLAVTPGRETLTTLMARATDEAMLERLVNLHARRPARTLYALGYAAVHYMRLQAPTDEALARIGSTLVRVREALIARGGEKARALAEHFAGNAAGAARGGKFAADFLMRDDAADRLLDWLEFSPERQLDEFEVRLATELADYRKMSESATVGTVANAGPLAKPSRAEIP